MNKHLTKSLLVLITSLAAIPASAEEARQNDPAQSSCRFLVANAKASWEAAALEVWNKDGYRELFIAALAFVDTLRPSDQPLLEAYRQGEAKALNVYQAIQPRTELVK